MTAKDISNLFETVGNTELKETATFKAMEEVLKLLAVEIGEDNAKLIVACTAFEVSEAYAKEYPEELQQCIKSFVKVTTHTYTALNSLLGEHWKEAIKVNPIKFKINW